MNRRLVPPPDERPSSKTASGAAALILIFIICGLGLLISLCAAIYGLDLSVNWLECPWKSCTK
jgi:hypothetical protein